MENAGRAQIMPGYKLFIGNKCPGFYPDKYGTYVVCGKEKNNH